MHVQENDGRYRKPENLNFAKLEDELLDQRSKRVIIFPAHGEDGKPTPELRRAWRRYNRTNR